MESKILYISDYKRRKGLMGIKLNYAQINSADLNQALMMLSSQNGFADIKASYNVARIKRQFESNLKKAREEYNEFVKEFAVKDENGGLKLAPNAHPYCPWELIPEKVKEFDAKLELFLKEEVELQSTPVKIEDLGSVKLSPQVLMSLEPILDPSVFSAAAETPHKA